MKKIININLASRLIPIEDSAYEILRQYLESLKRYFAREEGGDEIISDIEGRIAELFQDKLKKGAHCITDEDVVAVKASMGTPEQFGDMSESEGTQSNTENAAFQARPRKRLYRDPDNKVLGGVCSGMGAYFNVDPVVFRIIFALFAIAGFGSGILVYFILWIATPEANTATEKLEMRGERVDLNNIKATVQDEINSLKDQFSRMGSDVKNFSQGRGKQVGNGIERFFRGLFAGLGQALLFLTKGFIYFLAVVILIALVVSGIAIAASSAALFPIKSLLLTAGQSTLFWPAIVLVIGVPVVAIIIFLVRKITGVRETSRYVGYTLSFLWVGGVICALFLTVSLMKDFRTSYRAKEAFTITQPSGGKLIIKCADDLVDMDVIGFMDGRLRVTEDTAIIDNVRLKLEKSNSGKFEVEIYRLSRGRTIRQARQLAEQILFQLQQQDSVLYLPSGMSIPRDSKFRGQRITVAIRIPVDKQIEVDRSVRHHYDIVQGGDEHWWDNWNEWDEDGPAELKMTIDGLDNINTDRRHDKNEDEDQDRDNEDRDNDRTRENRDEDSLRNNYRYQGAPLPAAPSAPAAPAAPKSGSSTAPASAKPTVDATIGGAALLILSLCSMLK
ncbi:PspC domain-containing protein [Chitinophaga pendula]|uniref:PspC domain-containing protein n=1 Tax=Chitinophaga TaxID=79328 RepID=UPI000BB00978|nr:MULTISPECIES: PspC domain-containing protein [Chitinophaga]ASZ10386.1 hypothetical protein CK934_05015 [Chitinophaga sp. MD30]UCJ06648.1 PspC domain-containing protein [Chitinophaga pendula]